MKHRLRRLAALSLACMLPVTAAAETLELPKSLTLIESEAFAGDTSIGKVIVPEGTTEIQSQAFANSSVTEIVLPESLTTIADNMLNGCENVIITAPEGSAAYQWASANELFVEAPAILESEHPYSSFSDSSWEYTHPTEAYALVITFSQHSETEEYYDSLYLTDASGNETEYSGSLSGKQVIVKGNSFKLRLVSDDSMEYYGFRITKIEALESEEDVEAFGGPVTRTLEDGTLAITGYTGFATEIEIPAEINGVKVTKIDNNAFKDRDITAVTLPDGLTSIGDNAFRGCTQLTSIVIPDSVTDVGAYCFYGCTALESATLSANLYDLSNRVFEGCSSLGNVVIPDSVQYIYSGAFWNCVSMTQINIPKNVSYIDAGAFGASSDYSETKLASITVAEGNEDFSIVDGMLVHTNTQQLLAYPGGRTDESVTIPEGIVHIALHAFSLSDSLKSVTVPDHVKTIDESAFHYCSALETVILEEGVKTIGGFAFRECCRLTSITIPESVDNIGNHVFALGYDEDLGEVHTVVVTTPSGSYAEEWCLANGVMLSEGMERFVEGNYVFTKFHDTLLLTKYMGSEAEVVIPATAGGMNLTLIGKSAFFNNNSLRSVTVPEGVKTIGAEAFYACKNLHTVNLPSTLESIGDYAFGEDWEIVSLTLPDGLKSIGKGAFMYCEVLEEITIPGSVDTVGDSAFSDCYALKKLVLNGCRYVDHFAFQDCSSLESVTIAEGLEDIGAYTFARCTSLKEVVFPQSMTSFDNYILTGCSALERVEFKGAVDSIGISAFNRCGSLTEVVLPEGLKVINEYAFQGCSALKQINLPSTLENILWYAFAETGLESVAVPSSMEELDCTTFQGCALLKSIYIHSKVTTIYNEFSGCHADFTIYGESGSFAEAFANNRHIPFIAGALPLPPA